MLKLQNSVKELCGSTCLSEKDVKNASDNLLGCFQTLYAINQRIEKEKSNISKNENNGSSN